MITNAPKTLPNNRIHRDRGLMNTSRILIGVTIAIGSVKLLIHPPTPFLRMPAASTRMILISASAAVTFRSLVGGFIPNNPMILDMPRYNSTLTRYGTYRFPSSPIIPVTMPSSFVTIVSATSCRLLTLCTLRLLVRIIDKIRMTAMTTHVITTDSAISSCTPPIRGRPAGSLIENAVSQFSSFSSSDANSSIIPLPFRKHP